MAAHRRTSDPARKARQGEIIARLYLYRYDRNDAIKLSRFIDWLIRLPRGLELALRQELAELEEQTKMSYVTSWERFAREEGIAKGRQEGEAKALLRQLQAKFGPPTADVAARVQMAKRPGGELATRPLHVIWIADCSGSMSVNGKIEALNIAIREALPHMRAVADENPNAEVLVRALAFTDGARWQVSQPTSVTDFKWTNLQTIGLTAMGLALRMVAEQLRMPPMSDRALPPVLVLISDGQPTDDFSGADRPTGARRCLVRWWPALLPHHGGCCGPVCAVLPIIAPGCRIRTRCASSAVPCRTGTMTRPWCSHSPTGTTARRVFVAGRARASRLRWP